MLGAASRAGPSPVRSALFWAHLLRLPAPITVLAPIASWRHRRHSAARSASVMIRNPLHDRAPPPTAGRALARAVAAAHHATRVGPAGESGRMHRRLSSWGGESMRLSTLAAAAVLLSGLGVTTGMAMAPMSCDTDHNHYVTAREARSCSERLFDQIRAGQPAIGSGAFHKALPQARDPEALFKEVDQNGDGQISRQEWIEWRQRDFTDATAKSSGMLPAADYQNWSEGAYARPIHPADTQ
jgi:hypothetical protein